MNDLFLEELFRRIPRLRLREMNELCNSCSAAVALIDSLYYQTDFKGREMLARVVLRIGEAFNQQLQEVSHDATTDRPA